MATQFTYPGIFIQEFTPGAPIQGVGTSTGAFIGTAVSGPVNQPVQLTSWDEFVTVFAGFIAEPPASPTRSWLAPAVYGFFLNGGTTCYIVRAALAGTATMASISLPAQLPTQPTLIVTAIAEGSIGNSIQVTVQNSSLLESMLAKASLPATFTASGGLSAGAFTIPVTLPSPTTFVLNQALPAGALIQLVGATPADTEYVTVASSNMSSATAGTITLTTPLANNYAAAPQIVSLEFNLVVTAQINEKWSFLSMNPLHPNYWQNAVRSQVIALSLPSPPPATPATNPTPAPATYTLKNGVDDNRANDLNNPGGINTDPNTYLSVLEPLQDVDIVAIPANYNANVQQALVNHCEKMFNRFAVLDSLPGNGGLSFSDLLTQYGQVRTPDGFAAIYFPWIQVVNPSSGATEYWPPCGHIMGIYALTDLTRGVYKAPANLPIAGALGLQALLSNADQGNLNPLGINVLRVFPEQAQPLVWGARTTSTDSDWQYINIRRLFIYLEQSIEQGIRWAIFEPNNQLLWGKLKRSITDFLNRVQGDGGIISFYVRIDAALNPPATQALGQLYIEVGIQPAYPAEFIILRIGIWQGGSTVTES